MLPLTRTQLFFSVWSLAVAAVIAGCDRTSELAEKKQAAAGHFVAKDNAAGALLEQSAAAYQRLMSYSDSARVVLSYRVDGQAAQDTAPLAVAFERPNRLALKAYQTRAGVTDDRFRMRLTSDAASPLNRQLLSRRLPKLMDLNWLMLDALAAQHLAAGLAGAPPQLDLLLSDHPFRALLDASAVVSLDGEGAEKGKTYHIVKIERGEAKYRLWIDRLTSLLRRIELPTATLPKAMLDDGRITDIHLSIEFDNVIAGEPINWSQWQVPSEALDQLVRYFVAPPAIELDSRLGKAVPAFRLKSPLVNDKPDSDGIDTSRTAQAGQIQLLVWSADHPSCRATLAQVEQALKQLPADIRNQIAPVVVWAEPKPAAGTTFADLAEKWNFSFPIVLDDAAVGRDLFSVQEAPTIVILDGQHRLQFFQERANPLLVQALPEMLTRLAGGESLAKTMNDRMQAEQTRYLAQLWLARSSDCNAGAFTKPEPYAPQLVSLSEPQVHATHRPIAAMTADALHNLWTLTVDGELECRDSRGQSRGNYTTDWKSTAGQLVRLTVDAKGRYVAMRSAAAVGELRILDTESKKTSTISLGSNQAVTDFRWLATASGSRLAAITTASRTVLIDPARNEQHSGQSASPPLALLDKVEDDKVASGYAILTGGRIEPVILEDQAGAKQALAKPVSTGSDALPSPIVERQLKFTPAAGPWTAWHDAKQTAKQTATLARGWIAEDEPAVFLLDGALRQLWHAPLPITDHPEAFSASVAEDPVSGQPLWIVAQPSSTLHFFRADGGLVDHCQLEEPVRGLAAIPSGNELHLWIAHPEKLVRYRLR